MSTFIFDLDGTVYRDDVALPGARETIETLRRRGHRVLFASNNSTRTRDEYARKLAQMGLTIEPGGLVTSAYATGVYLRSLPEPHMYRALLDATGADPRTTVVVGDGMQTDIAAALPLGLYSVLVLTGVSAAPAADARTRPDLVVPSVADLIPALARVRPDLMG